MHEIVNPRQDCKIRVLTHAHEDHVGAVPYVLPLVDGRHPATGHRRINLTLRKAG